MTMVGVGELGIGEERWRWAMMMERRFWKNKYEKNEQNISMKK